MIYLTLAMVLSSCAGLSFEREQANIAQSHSDQELEVANALIEKGEIDTGILKMQELIKAHPDKPQYRTVLRVHQASQINGLLKKADENARLKLYSDAEQLYKQVLSISSRAISERRTA